MYNIVHHKYSRAAHRGLRPETAIVLCRELRVPTCVDYRCHSVFVNIVSGSSVFNEKLSVLAAVVVNSSCYLRITDILQITQS